MTRVADSGAVPDEQSWSSYTAVSGAAGDHDDGSALTLAWTRRGMERRLHDAGVRAVVDARRAVIAIVALTAAALAACQWLVDGPADADAIVVLLLLSLIASGAAAMPSRSPQMRPQDARRTRLRVAIIGGGSYLVLAAVPWLVRVAPSPLGPYAVALVLAVCATAAASLLAPLRHVALAAAALPLSALMAGLCGSEPMPGLLAALCGLAAALAVQLAVVLHRRWRAATRIAFEQEDRMQSLAAERDAAIRADQDKSRFLAIASHDLRQPVHAIGLFAATLDKRLEGSAEQPLVRNLSHAIDGLDRSFNVMLDISRLDAGAIEPRVQHFPLRDLFRRLHMHFAGQAEEKGLGLRFSPGGKSISSDPQLLERILGNLVQNAIKYTERGGIVVVARSTLDHVNIEVWDTGIGIREVDLRKVFDEFYQVGRGERVRVQGLGMGLAIVKRLVRLLGHELTVSSRSGRGTMFRLRIAVGGLPEIQNVTAAADTLPMPLLQPRTVLVVDDEQPIREGLCLLLHEWGYEAIAAGSIAEAERAVTELEVPPDLILSDLHLGDGPDGIVGIDAIRRRCGAEIAAILITGDTSEAEIRRATASGHPLLFKPVQPRKLYDTLRGMGP